MSERSTHYTEPVTKVLEQMGVEAASGLSPEEVEDRRERHGPNRLRRARQRSWWEILLAQFRSLIVGLLFGAGAVSAALGQFIEAVAILAAVLADVVIGFVTEMRARQSMEALHQFERATALVRRDGEKLEIDSDEVVPGDIALLEAGQVVPADLRLIETSDLEVDESALTGEPDPAVKSTEPLQGSVAAADRSNMAFRGTAVTRGQGLGVVVATGTDTEIGHISELVEEAEAEATPLEQRLDGLGRRLIWVTFAMAAAVAAAGLIGGRDMVLIIETAIILGIAAVPEGLPIVASLALARGVRRMANHNALVKRLSSVETLGSAGIIFTDKTGTLTEGRMEVARVVTSETTFARKEGRDEISQLLDRRVGETLAETAVMCTDADLDEGKGDPMDIALLELGRELGRPRDSLLEGAPLVDEIPFDSRRNMMATLHQLDSEKLMLAVKGAPEAVVDVATREAFSDGEKPLEDQDRQRWLDHNDRLAEEGLRVVAVACKETGEIEGDDPYHDLTMLGLIGFWDPPREKVVESVEECHRAGIRVVMVTGDHPATAQSIARIVGITDDGKIMSSDEVDDPDEESEEEQKALREVDVFARVSPENKLDLVTLHQQAGAVVAMTGDGINDAPALEKADIGVAMGKRGTQVAREAADIVLLDDAFSTIVTAVRYGRTVFTNIRKFVVFLLSGNLAEILAVAAATLVGMPLPLLPLQILYINFVADVFPALALGFGSPNRDVMAEPPRDPSEPILTRRSWGEVAAWGALIGVTVLATLLFGLHVLDVPGDQIAGITFLTFGFARVWHVFNMRRQGSRMLRNEITTNPYVWGALAIGVGLMLLAAFFGPLADLLTVGSLDAVGWTTIIVASLVPVAVGQIIRSWGSGNRE